MLSFAFSVIIYAFCSLIIFRTTKNKVIFWEPPRGQGLGKAMGAVADPGFAKGGGGGPWRAREARA